MAQHVKEREKEEEEQMEGTGGLTGHGSPE